MLHDMVMTASSSDLFKRTNQPSGTNSLEETSGFSGSALMASACYPCPISELHQGTEWLLLEEKMLDETRTLI